MKAWKMESVKVAAPKKSVSDQRDPMETAFYFAEMDRETRSIDLHGLREAEALAALENFLDECLARQDAAARIVHGKGQGRLRAMTHRLLEERRRRGTIFAYREINGAVQVGGATSVLFMAPNMT